MVLIPFPLSVYYRWYKIESSGGCQCFLWPEGVRYYVWQFSPIHWPEGHGGWPQNTTRYVLIALVSKQIVRYACTGTYSFLLCPFNPWWRLYFLHSGVNHSSKCELGVAYALKNLRGTLCALYLKFCIFAGHLQ